jgi:glycine betaine/proline transport system permease protein
MAEEAGVLGKIISVLTEFPDNVEIPLGDWTDVVMKWLIQHTGSFFDFVGGVILYVLVKIELFFLWVPWPIMIVFIFILGWYFLSWLYGLTLALMMFFIGTFGYWDYAMMTLALVTGAVLLSLIIGIPVGIAMSRSDRMEAIVKPLLDAMQTMPSFVYLIPALMFFGLGKVPAMLATIIYAVPPVIRLTNVGIREVPREVVEAAQAFGSNYWQVLFKVQLPLARPTIMVGINQTTMMALAMVVVASMIGAKGLGLEVLFAINRVEVGRGFESGLCIVFMAIIIDRLTHAMATRKAKA